MVLALMLSLGMVSVSEAVSTIDEGDYLRISVLGAQEFNRLVQVRPDGTVPYPYISDIPVVGMTTTELQTLLVSILQRYMDNPVVLIEKPETYTINVQVLGQVSRPGLVQVPVGTDIQSAISLAGGPADHADPSRVRVLRPLPSNGDDDGDPQWERIDVNLRQFLASGNVDELPKLRENDVVVVPSVTNNSSVMVVGWIQNPGNYVPYPDSNVLNIILQAGGFRPDGDRSNVRHLYQTGPGMYEEQTLDLQGLIEDGKIAQIPPVSSGDVIIVSEYDPFFTWDRMLAILRDVSVVASAYLIYLRIDRLESNN